MKARQAATLLHQEIEKMPEPATDIRVVMPMRTSDGVRHVVAHVADIRVNHKNKTIEIITAS
jgi:hypothetical protein